MQDKKHYNVDFDSTLLFLTARYRVIEHEKW